MLSSDLAAGLLQLLGLLTQYAQEKRQQSEPDRQTFQDWLAAHRHEEVRQLLATNHHLNAELHTLLRSNLSDLARSLQAIEAHVTTLLSRLPGFEKLAVAAQPDCILSSQVVHILRSWVATGFGQLRILQWHEGPWLQFIGPIDGQSAQLAPVPEPAFLIGDLETIRRFGFAISDCDSSGDEIFHLTRAGAAYVYQLGRPEDPPPPGSPTA